MRGINDADGPSLKEMVEKAMNRKEDKKGLY